MLTKNIILAVDDEPFNLEIMEEILSQDYEFHCAQSGPKCLKMMEQLKPNVILLDVSMPDMDGYEVCRQLKSNEETAHVPVMFVSARGALDERIEGYDAGGEDYIVKPFAREELEAKLKGLFKIQDHQKDLEIQVEQATEMAFSAMSNSSEVGIVMQFVEKTKELHTIEELCSALLETLAAYGLAASIELRLDGAHFEHHCSHGKVSPIVIELFDLLKGKGRIYSFEPRMMINYPKISILLMNMPQGDEDKMGRLRDHLCFIASSAEQCLSAVITERQLARQKVALKQTIAMIKARFEQLVTVVQSNHGENEAIFKRLQEQFELQIPSMGLDEDQELYIFRTLDETIQNSIGRAGQMSTITETFKEIEADLGLLMNPPED